MAPFTDLFHRQAAAHASREERRTPRSRLHMMEREDSNHPMDILTSNEDIDYY
jgi:hypothetical protein